ncbi:MAG: monovalent cation/H(+) antiporter subunit G [Gemmatimonadetes bacterium]|nr:monovalent cation/H(+) antiporter subunit G [Gemmatimonadota bacterium]
MQPALDVLTIIFLAIGCLLAVTGALGVLRMPDFYSRLHPAGKTDSLALVLIIIGLLFQTFRYPGSGAAVRLVMIAGFVFLTSPVATHAIAKAAMLAGLEPWRNPEDPHV